MNRIWLRTAPLLGFAAMAGLWACSASDQEKTADKQADQVKKSADKQADQVKKSADAQADQIKKNADKQADQMKDQAKQPAAPAAPAAPGSTTAPAAPGSAAAPAAPASGLSAKAKLNPTQGSQVAGNVTFTQTPQGVRVVGELMGLAPGDHGFHVHEKGDCSSPDGKSAGGHFNPGGHQHGGPADAQQHAGDMGNITADAQGAAKIDQVFKGMTLEGENSILGKGLIVHAKADDMKTQPTGDAGDRLACGVIEKQ